MRAFAVLLLALMPGGLVLLAGWVVTRSISARMRLERGDGPHRLFRAVTSVRWPDVWRETRAVIR